MFTSGLRNLQKMVVQEPRDLSDARTIAYAIYILTREGVITTNYILNLQDYLDKHQRNAWQNDLTGVYLAGALHSLHKDGDAEKLIAHYRIGRHCAARLERFLPAARKRCPIYRRPGPRIPRATGKDLLRRIPKYPGPDQRRKFQYSFRGLRSSRPQGLFAAISKNPPELTISEVAAAKNRNYSGQRRQITAAALVLTLRQEPSDFRRFRSGRSRRIFPSGGSRGSIASGARDQPLTSGLEVYRELLGKDNHPVTPTRFGETMHVRLHIRSCFLEPTH